MTNTSNNNNHQKRYKYFAIEIHSFNNHFCNFFNRYLILFSNCNKTND